MAYISNSPTAADTRAGRQFHSIFTTGAIGSLVLIVGTFLTWYVVKIDLSGQSSQTDVAGLGNLPLTDGSAGGLIAVVLGLIVLVFSGLGLVMGKKWLAVLVIIAGLLATGFMFLKLNDTASTYGLSITSGLGMYVSLAGALMVLAGGVSVLARRR